MVFKSNCNSRTGRKETLMVDNNKTCVVVVLDKSGSMLRLTEETVNGYNKLLKEQQELPGKCNWTTVLFNHKVEFLDNNVDIRFAHKLTPENYKADGYTALYDAIGMAINTTGERLAAMPEEQRPGNVVVVVIGS